MKPSGSPSLAAPPGSFSGGSRPSPTPALSRRRLRHRRRERVTNGRSHRLAAAPNRHMPSSGRPGRGGALLPALRPCCCCGRRRLCRRPRQPPHPAHAADAVVALVRDKDRACSIHGDAAGAAEASDCARAVGEAPPTGTRERRDNARRRDHADAVAANFGHVQDADCADGEALGFLERRRGADAVVAARGAAACKGRDCTVRDHERSRRHARGQRKGGICRRSRCCWPAGLSIDPATGNLLVADMGSCSARPLGPVGRQRSRSVRPRQGLLQKAHDLRRGVRSLPRAA